MRGDEGAEVAVAGELLGVHRGDDDRRPAARSPRRPAPAPRLGHEVGQALARACRSASSLRPRSTRPSRPQLNRRRDQCQRYRGGGAAAACGFPARRGAAAPAGTWTANSRMSRSRYVRCRPSARAARVRLPPSSVSVVSMQPALEVGHRAVKPGAAWDRRRRSARLLPTGAMSASADRRAHSTRAGRADARARQRASGARAPCLRQTAPRARGHRCARTSAGAPSAGEPRPMVRRRPAAARARRESSARSSCRIANASEVPRAPHASIHVDAESRSARHCTGAWAGHGAGCIRRVAERIAEGRDGGRTHGGGHPGPERDDGDPRASPRPNGDLPG